MGDYSRRIEKLQLGKTPAQLRSEKCQRTKTRNAVRKAENIARDSAITRKNPIFQLDSLNIRKLAAKKERAKLEKKLAN